MENVIYKLRLRFAKLDLILMPTIAMVVMLICFVTFPQNELSHEKICKPIIKSPTLIFAIGLMICFLKDTFNGRSLGKRYYRIQIENSKGDIATPLQCFIRNIFLLIWLIELIVLFKNGSRRIGDYVTGTKLVEYNGRIKNDYVSTIVIFIVGTLTIWYLLTPLETYFAPFGGEKADYIESSYNKEKSNAICQHLKDTLKQDFTPDIMIFENTEEQNSIYASVILKFSNYRDLDKYTLNRIDTITSNVINSQFATSRKNLKIRIQNYYKSKTDFKYVYKYLFFPADYNFR